MKPANETGSQPVKNVQGDGAQYPKTNCYKIQIHCKLKLLSMFILLAGHGSG